MAEYELGTLARTHSHGQSPNLQVGCATRHGAFRARRSSSGLYSWLRRVRSGLCGRCRRSTVFALRCGLATRVRRHVAILARLLTLRAIHGCGGSRKALSPTQNRSRLVHSSGHEHAQLYFAWVQLAQAMPYGAHHTASCAALSPSGLAAMWGKGRTGFRRCILGLLVVNYKRLLDEANVIEIVTPEDLLFQSTAAGSGARGRARCWTTAVAVPAGYWHRWVPTSSKGSPAMGERPRGSTDRVAPAHCHKPSAVQLHLTRP